MVTLGAISQNLITSVTSADLHRGNPSQTQESAGPYDYQVIDSTTDSQPNQNQVLSSEVSGLAPQIAQEAENPLVTGPQQQVGERPLDTVPQDLEAHDAGSQALEEPTDSLPVSEAPAYEDPVSDPPANTLPVGVESDPQPAAPGGNYELVVSWLPPALRAQLSTVGVTFGCHPEAGCHYGVWDYRTGTVWLSSGLLDDPDLLYAVLSHELAHVADTNSYSSELREHLYSMVPGYLDPGEGLADCVALMVGGYWTHYWGCPSESLRAELALALGL